MCLLKTIKAKRLNSRNMQKSLRYLVRKLKKEEQHLLGIVLATHGQLSTGFKVMPE